MIVIGQNVEVQGYLKIVDGTQGINKVLTSDSVGLASWQPPPAPPIDITDYQSVNICCNRWMTKNLNVDKQNLQKNFEMNKNAIKKGDKVLIVDEWIETGSQIKSAIKLIEKQGGNIIGVTTLYAEKTPKTKILFEKYNCKAIGFAEKH